MSNYRMGAIARIDDTKPLVITFQYNPENLNRSLTPNYEGGTEGEYSDNIYFSGVPTQTLSIVAHLDATDALSQGDATATQYGIYPQIAALELLIYPKSADIVNRDSEITKGAIELEML